MDLLEGNISGPAGFTWYKCYGSGIKNPLVLIHGGPGFPSSYLEPLLELEKFLPVVRYDQAGCGNSNITPRQAPISVASFIDELKLLLDTLNIKQCALYGHSWGAVVAAEYALAHSNMVEKIIFASPSLNIPRWRNDSALLRSKLGMLAKMILNDAERRGVYSDPVYLEQVENYYKLFVIGQDKQPPQLLTAASQADTATYNTMWGPNELVINGLLSEYDITPRLGDISVPVLLTCGRHDESTPEALEELAAEIKNCQLKIFENSAHHPQLTETASYLETIRHFLMDS